MDTVGFLNSIKNLTEKNNTTTSSTDISGNLNKRVCTFLAGVNNFSAIAPIATTSYPALSIEMNNKDQAFGLIGNTAKREQKINFSIVCITQYNANDIETAAQESIYLADNIEELFRNKVVLSQTSIVLKANAVSTEYGFRMDESYKNYASKITIEADIWST